jgi:hypothetical protein
MSNPGVKHMAKRPKKEPEERLPVTGDVYTCDECGMRLICVIDCSSDGSIEMAPVFKCCNSDMTPA